MAEGKKFRMVTRGDFDGLVCAVLLAELNLIDDIVFAHPKDVQDGVFKLSENDITANLPFDERVHISFDHHLSEAIRVAMPDDRMVNISNAPSTAQVVFDYYGREKFHSHMVQLVDIANKVDAAHYTTEDVLEPKDWELLSFIIDPRTGLGRFSDGGKPVKPLMVDLVDYCRNLPIERIMELPDVASKAALLREHEPKCKEQLLRCSKLFGNCVVIDLREEETIWSGNRFLIYALFPDANISIHVLWGFEKQKTVLAVGKSIINRTSKTNIGSLMLEFGGGGHANAGTCQVANKHAQMILSAVIDKINADG